MKFQQSLTVRPSVTKSLPSEETVSPTGKMYIFSNSDFVSEMLTFGKAGVKWGYFNSRHCWGKLNFKMFLLPTFHQDKKWRNIVAKWCKYSHYIVSYWSQAPSKYNVSIFWRRLFLFLSLVILIFGNRVMLRPNQYIKRFPNWI